MVRVALDAMGGDLGVAEVVAGAARLSREERPVRIFLVGEEDARRVCEPMVAGSLAQRELRVALAPHTSLVCAIAAPGTK